MRRSSLRQAQGQNDNFFLLVDGNWEDLSCHGQLFFQTLLFKEAGVVAVACDEFVVSAEFGYAAADQDGDLVGVAGGGDAVGDEDGRSAFHVSLEAAQDPLF